MRNSGIVALAIVLSIFMLIAFGFLVFRQYMAMTTGGFTERTMKGHTPAQLPDGWPVAFLKLPPAATEEYLHSLPSADDPGNTVSVNLSTTVNNIPAEIWRVGFDSDLGWKEMSDFVDDCMRGHGYVITRDDPPGTNPVVSSFGTEMDFGFRNYTSDDGLIRVQLFYCTRTTAPLTPGFDGYVYEIYVLERPLWPMSQLRTKPIPGSTTK